MANPIQLSTHSPAARISSPTDWRGTAGLLFLSLVPVVAGLVRVHEIGTTDKITTDNARFLASPIPALLHIVLGSTYLVLGALQISPAMFRRFPRWHRKAGRVVAPAGVVAAFAGLWMNWFYPPMADDGTGLFLVRNVIGWAWVFFIVLGVKAVLRRDVVAHKAWMLRGYAIAIGAGTQVFTHLPLLVEPELRGVWARFICMTAGWAINLAVAEWVIRRDLRSPPSRALRLGASLQ